MAPTAGRRAAKLIAPSTCGCGTRDGATSFHHIAGTVNPVAGPYFNFTFPEPTGVVGIVGPEKKGLSAMVARLAPALVAGNTTVVLAAEAAALVTIDLGEVLAASDVPSGVVNILTGDRRELLPWIVGHRDVNAVDVTGAPADLDPAVLADAADNVKRIVRRDETDQSPYAIFDFCEMKTVWHPVGR